MRHGSALVSVLPRLLLTQGVLPEDWEPEATTYDLPRFHNEKEFLSRLNGVAQTILKEDITDPFVLRSLLAECGHPYDYARLGHPLSTIYEEVLAQRTGFAKAISFASATKPYLSVIEARTKPLRAVHLYVEGTLGLSEKKQRVVANQKVVIHENWGSAPLVHDPAEEISIYVYTEADTADLGNLSLPNAQGADAVCFQVPNGGVLLLRGAQESQPNKIDTTRIQLIRKRTVAALLAADAKAELLRLVGSQSQCDRLLSDLYPEVTRCAYFCTGLAAEAAVFAATASVLGEGVKLFHAQNGYGGTCQLIGELLPNEAGIVPMPLQVVGSEPNRTLIDRFIAALAEVKNTPAMLFLETPTNPELQVHDFAKLKKALVAHKEQYGQTIPVLVDTTLAPLYPIFAKDFAKDWPFLLVKSGSKYFTKGKATLGVVCSGAHPLSLSILEGALQEGQDADSFAKPSQLLALAAGLVDLRQRMGQIAANTKRLAELIRQAITPYAAEPLLYTVSDDQVDEGLATGILSFYLPFAKTSYGDLVDEFVDYLLVHAPGIVKNRVSYGQSSGQGRPDVFYVINPQESTQGSLPHEVKAAQKRDNVQICRISVPAQGDVEALGRVIASFCETKYGQKTPAL